MPEKRVVFCLVGNYDGLVMNVNTLYTDRRCAPDSSSALLVAMALAGPDR